MSARTVAGVRIPDSAVARDAETLVADTSPRFLLEHSRRCHVFAALLASATGIAHDEELLYLCTILHDLGLTDRFATGERLEVAGARAAEGFAREHGLPEHQTTRLWDAVALHASVGIAEAKGGEVALTHFGIGADLMGARLELLPAGALEEILVAFPRLNFKQAILDLFLVHAAKDPTVYVMTGLSDCVRAHLAPSLPTFDDLLFGAPFDE